MSFKILGLVVCMYVSLSHILMQKKIVVQKINQINKWMLLVVLNGRRRNSNIILCLHEQFSVV
jgi:hypothetical protein